MCKSHTGSTGTQFQDNDNDDDTIVLMCVCCVSADSKSMEYSAVQRGRARARRLTRQHVEWKRKCALCAIQIGEWRRAKESALEYVRSPSSTITDKTYVRARSVFRLVFIFFPFRLFYLFWASVLWTAAHGKCFRVRGMCFERKTERQQEQKKWVTEEKRTKDIEQQGGKRANELTIDMCVQFHFAWKFGAP